MAHARTAILAAFHDAMDALASQPQLYTQRAVKIPHASLPAVVVMPGEETVEGHEHGVGLPTLRKLRVQVVCYADSEADADELADEVEAAAPYTTAGLGAYYAGSDFAADDEGEAPIYSVRVNFDVTYEVSRP